MRRTISVAKMESSPSSPLASLDLGAVLTYLLAHYTRAHEQIGDLVLYLPGNPTMPITSPLRRCSCCASNGTLPVASCA